MLGQPLGEIQRDGPADIMLSSVHFGLECRIGLGGSVRLLQIEDQRISVSATKRPPKCRNARFRRGRCGMNWQLELI